MHFWREDAKNDHPRGFTHLFALFHASGETWALWITVPQTTGGAKGYIHSIEGTGVSTIMPMWIGAGAPRFSVYLPWQKGNIKTLNHIFWIMCIYIFIYKSFLYTLFSFIIFYICCAFKICSQYCIGKILYKKELIE